MSKFQNITTKQLVQQFLGQGKESIYCDFKQEWHNELSDLIKDIICFANSVHDDNCYLVFGISDDLLITGMKKERRKQADIIEGISNLHFAGDNYPKISVETINLKGIDLDVLIIYNTKKTPIFLKKTYGNMRMGCIYSRVEDKNTPDNSNADIQTIENLWRKRFGLINTPLEYIYDHLDAKAEWTENENYFFNTLKPEYIIEIVDESDYRETDEFYSYAMCNERTYFQKLNLRFQQTIIDTYEIVILDSGRLRIPIPEWGFISRDREKITDKYSYKYYIIGSKRYQLLTFLFDQDDGEEQYAFNNLKEVILFFKSESERFNFEKYIEEHQDLMEDNLLSIKRYDHINTGNQRQTEHYRNQLHVGLALNELLIEWKNPDSRNKNDQ